ncbi:PH domain-containing protein [Candidatus Parcubacteria bacterium]|nr:MAG: PH domain-containing protein [Candidatus Parcubacteria bacterium]
MFNLLVPNKEHDEKIIMLLRRHWFIIWLKIFFFGLAGILPVIFYFMELPFFNNINQNNIGHALLILSTSVYYLYIWLFLFVAFVDYYLDVWIVTNKRILNVEQHGLFHRTVSEQRLYRIQDVTSELKGIFSTMFNYGTVHIQTAGEKARFVFKEVPDPHNIAKKVMMMAEQSKKFKWVMENEKL